ncbi:hypothetical protein JXR93_13910 [bacterium]|nr:hypothetical protein [bacterium]
MKKYKISHESIKKYAELATVFIFFMLCESIFLSITKIVILENKKINNITNSNDIRFYIFALLFIHSVNFIFFRHYFKNRVDIKDSFILSSIITLFVSILYYYVYGEIYFKDLESIFIYISIILAYFSFIEYKKYDFSTATLSIITFILLPFSGVENILLKLSILTIIYGVIIYKNIESRKELIYLYFIFICFTIFYILFFKVNS